MKNVPCLAATLILSAVFAASTRADDSPPAAPSVSDTLALQDPDGTPLVISHPKAVPPSQSQVDAARKREQQADSNKDWLLESYEKQLQLRAAKEPGSQDNNLYYRIASDSKLSKLAGVSTLDSSAASATAALRTGTSASGKSTLSLRSDSSAPGQGVVAPSSTFLFKPLITPLGAADAAGLHNLFGPSPSDPPADAPQHVAPIQNPADLDIPGKVAAESDPLAKGSLTFDSSSDDPLPDKVSHHDNSSKDELPLGTNASQIQKLNATALNVPGTVKTPPPATVSSLQLKLDEPPPTKLPPPSPVRQPIANPYSILDR